MCEAPSWKLEPQSLPPIPHKHLYLWSDHHTKGARWSYSKTKECTFFKEENTFIKLINTNL